MENKKRFRRVLIIFTCIICLFVMFLEIVPNYRYKKAYDYYEATKYDYAIEIFKDLDGYKNSNEMLLVCKYANGMRAYENADYDLAKNIFGEIVGYKDAATKIVQIEYIEALELLEQGKTEEAISLLTNVLTRYGNSNIGISIFIAIVTSLLASFIFWVLMEKVFKKKSNDRIKMLLSDKLSSFYFELYHMFYDLKRYDDRKFPLLASIFYHDEIISGKLNRNTLKCLFSNKCWGEPMENNQISISNELKEHIIQMNNLYEKIIAFSIHLPTDLVVLIDVIVKNLNLFKCEANITLQGEYHVIDMYFFLYKQLVELQTKIIKLKFIDMTIINYTVEYYYQNCYYSKCKKMIRKIMSKYENYPIDYWLHEVVCDYKIGNKGKAYKNFEKRIANEGLNNYSPSLLKTLIEDENIVKIIAEHYDQKHFDKYLERIRKDIIENEKYRQEYKDYMNQGS